VWIGCGVLGGGGFAVMLVVWMVAAGEGGVRGRMTIALVDAHRDVRRAALWRPHFCSKKSTTIKLRIRILTRRRRSRRCVQRRSDSSLFVVCALAAPTPAPRPPPKHMHNIHTTRVQLLLLHTPPRAHTHIYVYVRRCSI